MDLVPNNINLVQVYKKLSKKSQKSNYRIIVFPLVCAEYYFICTLAKHTILDKEAAIETVKKIDLNQISPVNINWFQKEQQKYEMFLKRLSILKSIL